MQSLTSGRLENRRDDPKLTLSIVCAFYNEESAIPFFFAEIDRIVQQLPCRVELVCVNDGSLDRTWEMLLARAHADPRVRAVNLARNFGKEAAIAAGLAQSRGHAIVMIDADLQDPPSLILDFYAGWKNGFDVVYGVRASRKSDSFLKRETARLFYALFNHLTDAKIPLGAGDFRLMDRRVVQAVLSLPERNRFTKGLFSWVGFRQTGVNYTRAPRIAGKSGWGWFRLFNFAIDGITSFSIAPLRVASFCGVTVSILGFTYAGYLVTRTVILGIDVPGYASTIVLLLMLGGLQLACLGLMGEYIGRLYIESKGRPLYIVSDTYSKESAEDDDVPN